MVFRLIFLITILSYPAWAQWEAGASFNYKSEVPEKGFGIYASRNLPIQFADVGIKTRAGIDFFTNPGNGDSQSSEELHADLVATLFYLDVQPYFGLSFGAAHYSINDFDEYIFFLGSLAGLRIAATSWLYPFVEIFSNYYSSDFNSQQTMQNISSLQVAGRAGFVIKF